MIRQKQADLLYRFTQLPPGDAEAHANLAAEARRLLASHTY